MDTKHPFDNFLNDFVPELASKTKRLNKAIWILETTGSPDAADLKGELDADMKLLLSDRNRYDTLLEWDQDISLKDPLLKRQLNILIRTFKQNLTSAPLLKEISQKEAKLALSYANFRSEIDGKQFTDNEIRQIFKKETNPSYRKKAWEASKKIGEILAPQILSLVSLRNQVAQNLGYSDYFQMQLELQEVDEDWLFYTFDELSQHSDAAYSEVLKEIQENQSQKFKIAQENLEPWAWSDPFSQEDPLDKDDLDAFAQNLDILNITKKFYQEMGFDIESVLARSDMFERPGKNQHAFCINIDRESDIRTLNNLYPSIKWLEILLHELGHAVYELGFDKKLPWILREPPHMMTTEAMALIAGRQAYCYSGFYDHTTNHSFQSQSLLKKGKNSHNRHQLIFSRWVLVMTYFERELYRNPEQDLNKLWWNTVEKHQKIQIPQGREGKSDWAAKYHISLVPVYYYSYLLGELLASAIEETITHQTRSKDLASKKVGNFLQMKLFSPGNSMPWNKLIQHVTGRPLSSDAWISQFCSYNTNYEK